MNNTQAVQGAGALSELFRLLFKGVDKILDSAAEYQNEMGVLKQISTINVRDSKGKEYFVKIKLAPVKDKDGIFYVETESNYPGFNGSSIDKKTMTINKQNVDDFNKAVAKLLDDNDLTRIGNKGQTDNSTIACYDERKFTDWKEDGGQGQKPKKIKVEVEITESASSKGKFDLFMKCGDVKLRYDDHDLTEDNVTDLSKDEVEDVIDKVLYDSHLIRVEEADAQAEDLENASPMDSSGIDSTASGIANSKHVDVTLSYIKSSEEVTLNAIYASYDVNDAMNALQQVVDNDDFVAVLTEDPQSFRITDEGDDFDVVLIDQVDVESAESDIYTSLSALSGLLDAYSVNFDPQQQVAADNLLNAIKKAQECFNPCPDQSDEIC